MCACYTPVLYINIYCVCVSVCVAPRSVWNLKSDIYLYARKVETALLSRDDFFRWVDFAMHASLYYTTIAMELYHFILIDQNVLGQVKIARPQARQIINWINIIISMRCTADRFLRITFHRHQ